MAHTAAMLDGMKCGINMFRNDSSVSQRDQLKPFSTKMTWEWVPRPTACAPPTPSRQLPLAVVVMMLRPGVWRRRESAPAAQWQRRMLGEAAGGMEATRYRLEQRRGGIYIDRGTSLLLFSLLVILKWNVRFFAPRVGATRHGLVRA